MLHWTHQPLVLSNLSGSQDIISLTPHSEVASQVGSQPSSEVTSQVGSQASHASFDDHVTVMAAPSCLV